MGSSLTKSGDQHAFLYTGIPGAGGHMIDLGTLGGPVSRACAINDRGQIAGWSQTIVAGQTRTHAFLYSGGRMIDLGTLGGSASNAYGLNNGGQVVGWSYNATAFDHAFLGNTAGAPAAVNLLLQE